MQVGAYDLLHQADFTELKSIARKYNFKSLEPKACLKLKVWTFVEQSIN